jgi:nucleoside-diphosphate-sugar epimerase
LKRVLITGATGFLGGAIVARCLAEGAAPNLLLLARAPSAEAGLRRITEQLRRFEVPEAKLRALSVRQVVLGDLRDFSGMRDDPRLRDVTQVIHCAALASFGSDPRIWDINVDATLAFADQARRWPRLERFLHVGTAMSCGIQATSPVPEDYDAGAAAEHLVPYTASKAAAEARMRAELPDLPLIVARPSIVVGHTRLGCAPSPSIFWVFRVAKALGGFLCAHHERIDVIPVDYCADVLFGLATRPQLAFDRYHVSAGEAASCTFREIDAGMSQALGVAPAGNFAPVSLKAISAMHPQFEQLFGPCNKFLMLRAIESYGRFAALNILFDNRRLLQEGFPVSPRFTDYIGRCAITAQSGLIAEQMRTDLKWDQRVPVTQ